MSKSAIITFLSVKKEGGKEEQYTVAESGSTISGILTNDAPVKYLFQQSEQNHNVIDRIVCIISKEVYAENSEESTYYYFQNMVKKDISSDIEVVSIPYDFETTTSSADGTSYTSLKTQQDKALSVYKGISEKLADYDELYIDYTGGFRDVSFLMTVLIRYLEFTGITCKDIVYSNYQEKKIYSLSYIYDMFKLLNAVSQFVETGSGKQLNDIYDSNGSEPTGNLVKCICEFSNVICLCNVGGVDKVVNEMTRAISDLEAEYQRMGDNIQETDVKDIQVHMFRDLLQVIKKKFYIEKDNVSFSYPKLIKWCIDNDLLQQAMTLYVEKMPIQYRNEGLIEKTSEDSLNGCPRGRGQSQEVYEFYTVLFDKIYREDTIGKSINAFQSKIKEIKDKSIETVRENSTDEIMIALRRAEKAIRTHYQENDNNQAWSFCGIKIKAKTKEAFINSLANNSPLAYAFICNDEKKVQDYKKSTGFYGKKITALRALCELEDISCYTKLTKLQLYNIMLYYLAIKYMRNQINHANENENREDDKYLEEYLMKKNIKVDITVENVGKVLLDGLCITNKELCKG